jgi:hypothetical protein
VGISGPTCRALDLDNVLPAARPCNDDALLLKKSKSTAAKMGNRDHLLLESRHCLMDDASATQNCVRDLPTVRQDSAPNAYCRGLFDSIW